MKDIQIGNFRIGKNHKPFIIAELSGNHNGSLEKALQLVDSAAASGAHAIKLQTYRADTLTIDCDEPDFVISNPNSLWFGKKLFDLYNASYTPWEWHEALFNRCKKHDMLCFSTPFDESSVDFLQELNVDVFKIASFENNHLPLLKKVAQTGKPVIMSTGISTLADLELSVQTLKENGCNDLILLKCTSTYPASPETTNIYTIPHLAEMFNCHVGLSDHTLGVGVAVASIALGARVIEKHFTNSRAEGGVDAAFSLEPHEFELLVDESLRAFLALGKVHYGIMPEEIKSLSFKRSLYVVKDVKKGDVLTTENMAIIRPGFGLPPKYFDEFLGRRVTCDLGKGTPVSFNII